MIMCHGYLNAIVNSRRNSKTSLGLSAYKVALSRVRHGIGPRYFMLFQLYNRRPDSWAEYILDTESNPKLRNFNSKGLSLARDKLAFARHCLINRIPTIPIIGFIDQSNMVDLPGVPKASTEHEWKEILAGSPDEVFIKTIDGAHGDGAFRAERAPQEAWKVNGQLFSSQNLYRKLTGAVKNKRGWLVQPSLRPHKALSPLMPGDTLGTIRAVTYLTADGPALLLPVMRLPARGNQTDNFTEGRTGNIVSEIDDRTGILSSGFTSKSITWPNMVRVTNHPDTGATIEGTQIPNWSATRDLVLSAHRMTPELTTVGWDIAVTDNGPVIVEANAAYGPNLLQVAYQRGLRSEFEMIFRRCTEATKQMRNG